MGLSAAVHVRGGVQVDWRPVKPDASGRVLERYLFRSGKLTRQRVPRSTETVSQRGGGLAAPTSGLFERLEWS
jgi:hypothetical protein